MCFENLNFCDKIFNSQPDTNQQNKNEVNTNQTVEQNVVDTSTNVTTESKPENELNNELNSVENNNIV